MDVFLEEKCPNLLELIKECGYIPEDVARDPFYCVLGLCSDEYFHTFVKQNHDEIEAAIQFASEWAIDPQECDLSSDEKRVKFALMYLAVELEEEVEYETA